MGNLMDSVSEKYDALSDEEKKLTSKEEILAQVDQEISGSGFFEAFDKNFDATKLGLFISLIVIIVLLGASFLAICLINKNMLQSFFEFSLVSFFGALIPLFFFKLFLKFQSYGFGYLPPEFDADSVVFASSVSDCVFSKSLALFSTVCFYSVIALLILAVLFYFLNRRSAT